MNKPIILYENMRTVVYVPFYMAIERGDWAAMGIDVAVELSASTSETAQGLIDGRVDVAQPVGRADYYDPPPFLHSIEQG